jgi:DNA-directed RNA polymerase specialized sigma24 family protein
MPGDSKATLSVLTGEAILAGAFDRLRSRLVAMINRRVSTKLAARIDPEGVVHDAFLRARLRWQALTPKPDDLDAWIYGQVLDRFREVVRSALGPEHDVDRDIAWAEGSAAPLAEHLVHLGVIVPIIWVELVFPIPLWPPTREDHHAWSQARAGRTDRGTT